jgi:hypothetical protein
MARSDVNIFFAKTIFQVLTEWFSKNQRNQDAEEYGNLIDLICIQLSVFFRKALLVAILCGYT